MLLRGGEIYAPEPLGRQDILIAGERIAAVAPRIRASRTSLPGLTVHALEGRAVLPGFIDAHVHIAGGGGEGGFSHRTAPVQPHMLLLTGTTTVVGLLGTDGVTRSVAELLAEARSLQAQGMSAHILVGAYQVPTRTLTGSVRSDIVYLPEALGAGEIAIADDRGSHPSSRDLLGIASEVRVGALLAGKKGILHIHVGDGAERLGPLRRALRLSALPSDLFSATHMNRNPDLFSEAADLTRRGAYADVTAGVYPAPGDERPIDPAHALAELLRTGDPNRVTMSSDGNGSSPVFDASGHLSGIGIGDPGRLFWAFRRAVQREGVSLEQAAAAVSRTVAQALGLVDRGRVAVGMQADLLVLGDGLQVDEVYARGRLVARRGQLLLKSPFIQEGGNSPSRRVRRVSKNSPAGR